MIWKIFMVGRQTDIALKMKWSVCLLSNEFAIKYVLEQKKTNIIG